LLYGFYLNNYHEVKGKLIFDENLKIFIAFSSQKGLFITDKSGKMLLEDETFFSHIYSKNHQIFLSFECKNIHLCQITF